MKTFVDELVKGFRYLVEGLRVTWEYLFAKPVTMKYPYERRELPPGYRGLHVLKVDPETGEMKCTGCQACARACPNKLITIKTSKVEGQKRLRIDSFDMDLSRCFFCHLCVDACPADAIDMTDRYELAVYTREEIVYHKDQLLEAAAPRSEPVTEER